MVQMGGAEEAQNAEEAQSWIAVLCVILLTCVKFDLGCGFGVYHTLGLHELGDGGKQLDDPMHHLSCTFAPCPWVVAPGFADWEVLG